MNNKFLDSFEENLQSYKLFWFPSVPEDDKQTLRNKFTYTNLFRLRLVAWPLILIQILISPIIVKTSYYSLIPLLALVGFLLIFLATSSLPPSPEGLTRRHRFYDDFLVPFILMVYIIYTILFMAGLPSATDDSTCYGHYDRYDWLSWPSIYTII